MGVLHQTCVPARLLTALLTLLCASPALAQEPMPPGDAQYDIPYVPALRGAFTSEFHFQGTFGVINGVSLGGAAGYRVFLDPHGQLNLTTRLRLAHTLDTESEARQLQLGGDVGLYVRSISDQFFTVGIGFVFMVEALKLSDHPDIEPASEWGYRIGLGLETNFGMLWYLDPYLFFETGALATANWVDLGAGLDGWQLMVQGVVRFDWAFVDSDPGAQRHVDELYRMLPRDE